MRRVIDPQTGLFCIRYAPKDRIVFSAGAGQRLHGRILSLGNYNRGGWTYRVLADGEKTARVIGHGQIIKQADTGGTGRIEHVEAV
jgi:hypothetical protein